MCVLGVAVTDFLRQITVQTLVTGGSTQGIQQQLLLWFRNRKLYTFVHQILELRVYNMRRHLLFMCLAYML